MKRVCLVRLGHLGDVLLSEPIAAAFVAEGWEVHLCTRHAEIGDCLDSYSMVRPFSDYEAGKLAGYTRIHVLRYELQRQTHHLDAYAADAGVELTRRVPRLRKSFARNVSYPYGLICPETSWWMKDMRSWPRERFGMLQANLQRTTSAEWITLEPWHTFDDMMSLIEHAECVVTNDSGPAHVAQAVGRPTVVIFGPTSPDYLLTSERALGVVGTESCQGCRHVAVDRSVACANPACISSVSVGLVMESVRKVLDSRFLDG